MLYLLNSLTPLSALSKTHALGLGYKHRMLEEVKHIVETEFKPEHKLRLRPMIVVIDSNPIAAIERFSKLLGITLHAKVRPFLELKADDRIITVGPNYAFPYARPTIDWTEVCVYSCTELDQVVNI